MFIVKLLANSDLYFYILGFIGYDRDTVSLASTSRELRSICYNRGFRTQLKTTFAHNIMNFIQQFNIHRKTLNNILMIGIDDPQLWLPNFTKTVKFEHTTTPKYFNIPGNYILPTENFSFTDYNRRRNKRKFKTDWSRFRNLKFLQLIVWDADLTGLDLDSLDGYYIDTNKGLVNNMSSNGVRYVVTNK